MILETEKFPNIKNNIMLESKIISNIKNILNKKLEEKEINGKYFVELLTKLKNAFNDKLLFDKDFKIKIFKYFIGKCYEKDNDVIQGYKNNKIYELFITEKKIDIFLILKTENKKKHFNFDDNFIDFLPDDLSVNDLGIIDDLINEVIKASKIDRNDDNNEVDM